MYDTAVRSSVGGGEVRVAEVKVKREALVFTINEVRKILFSDLNIFLLLVRGRHRGPKLRGGGVEAQV